MRIGIDMRMAGTGEGIGRYSEELVRHLTNIDRENKYFLIFQDEAASAKYKVQNEKFRKIITDNRYYSWAEQTRLIGELWRLKLDLVHFTNFNFPIFYPGKFVVTIHDLIHHHFPGKKKSRVFHRLAYRLTMRAVVKKAAKIITVSEGTKTELMKIFLIPTAKITVIYEGLDERFFRKLDHQEVEQVKAKFGIKKPYLLFVGVWRQYKNLPRLAQAFDILKEKYGQDLQLVLVGKIDPFYPEIKKAVFAARNAQDIIAPGVVADEDLIALYQGTTAFVLPSLVEGFGLIGVEAQASETPVLASDIPVLREVLGDSAVFFNPQSEEDMAEKFNQVLSDQNLRTQLVETGQANARKYSWNDAARKTLEIYKSV